MVVLKECQSPEKSLPIPKVQTHPHVFLWINLLVGHVAIDPTFSRGTKRERSPKRSVVACGPSSRAPWSVKMWHVKSSTPPANSLQADATAAPPLTAESQCLLHHRLLLRRRRFC